MSEIVDYDGVRFVGESEDTGDEPVSSPMMFRQAEDDEEQQQEKAWVPYEGPRGGEGWRNTDTGERRYQEKKPEGRSTPNSEGDEVFGTVTIGLGGGDRGAVGLNDIGNWEIPPEAENNEVPALSDDNKVRRYDVGNPEYKTYPSARMKRHYDDTLYIEFDDSHLTDINRDKVNEMITEAANTFDLELMEVKFRELNEYISTMVHPHVDWEVYSNASGGRAAYPVGEKPAAAEVAQLAYEFYNAVLDAEERGWLDDVSRIVGTNREPFNYGASGSYGPSTGELYINPMVANKTLMKRLKEEGSSSTAEPIATFWHELTHVLHYGNKFKGIDAPEEPLKEYMRDFGLMGSRLSAEQEQFAREHLSDYAATSHMEFIAEAASAAQTGELDLTDEQMDFVVEVFEQFDGPTELLE